MHSPNLAAWQFKTARFRVTLHCKQNDWPKYDGEDADGSIQRGLDCGDMVSFDAYVNVWLGDTCVGVSSLGDCVYDAATVKEFWTAHRDPDPMNRNCTIFRAAKGENHCIAHYFPDLVREAIREARDTIVHMPKMRGRGYD